MTGKQKNLVDEWILRVDNDLKTAEILLKADEVLHDIICFHCQRSAEKYLKALVSKDIEPEKTHSIENLLKICIGLDKSFMELRETGVLTSYVIEGRYLGDYSAPSKEEADIAYDLALKVKKFVLAKTMMLKNLKKFILII